MKKLKVLLVTKLSREQIAYLKSKIEPKYEFIEPDQYTKEELVKLSKDADILLGDVIYKEMLEGNKIKFIQVPWAGVDKLDYELLNEFDIPVYNSHSNALPVAEFAVGLLLSIAKKIPYHDKLLRQGDWNRRQLEGENKENQNSSYISNKTIGFIGYGNIGRTIGRLIQGFNPNIMVIVSDKNRKYEEVSFVGDHSDLDYVLENSDYLVIASALTDKTKHMINSKNISKMKDTAYIINISRGLIIEEEALYNAVKNRTIAGAAIDTWYNYPTRSLGTTNPSNYDFSQLNNIILSPHRAAQCIGGFPYFDHAIENLEAYYNGEELINRLSLKKGY